MGSAAALRGDYSPSRLRQLARHCKDSKQSSRLLSLAAVLDGMSRTDAARVGGMDRQTPRDWVRRFNDHGPFYDLVGLGAMIDADILHRRDSDTAPQFGDFNRDVRQ